jgi:pyridoxine 5-phosphate synthase
MLKKRLGVNIDHVATIRNARGELYPDPTQAGMIVQEAGADSLTIHLREDRRHIKDLDLANLKKKLKIPLNLEISPTKEMIKIALKFKPNFVCFVPEKRSEITTEGGLDLKKNYSSLKKSIQKLKDANIRVSLFIEPKVADVNLSKSLNANCVELHTGNFCKFINNKKKTKINISILRKTALHGKKNGLEIHAGHGLTYKSAKIISKIPNISEFNIGHFIIAESMFIGLKKAIKKFISIINH